MTSRLVQRWGFKSEWNEIGEAVEEWLREESEQTETSNGVLVVGFLLLSVLSLFLSTFTVLIPLVHGMVGRFLYRRDGWKFYQPGVGGPRFIALNAMAWSFYAITIVLQVSLFASSSLTARLSAFLTGFLSLTFMASSLLTYQPPKNRAKNRGVAVSHYVIPSEEDAAKEEELEEWVIDEDDAFTPVFNKELQENGYLMNQAGTGPNAFWWIFIGLNLGVSAVTSIILFIAAGQPLPPLQILSVALSLATFASVISITHALGGQWFHISSRFAAFQPGVGGFWFVLYQAIGWTLFGLSLLVGVGAMAVSAISIGGDAPVPPGVLIALYAIMSFSAEALIVTSLFEYEDDSEIYKRRKKEKGFWAGFTRWMLARVEDGQRSFFANVYGLRVDRKAELLDPEGYKKGEERWEELTANCSTTGDLYLVVGVGFIGKRLVQRLLDRGETKIRLFDIAPYNPFEGDERVEFFRGDVTKLDDIAAACEGVDTIYATFAVIRFSDRLDFQAGFSYHINVNGTKTLLQAVKKKSVPRVIVTSSSHATTDEDSQPRLGRDETAPYVTRETAHNHYGWTKALADKYALAQNGTKLDNGQDLKVVIVRPCSGIFGGDDKIQFERFFNMGIGPCLNAKYVIDWTYVDNIVLGHILAEARLQEGKEGIAGEAFCISNGDAITMPDFFYLCKQHLQSEYHVMFSAWRSP